MSDFWTEFRTELRTLGLTPAQFIRLREEAWSAERKARGEQGEHIEIPRSPGYAKLVAEVTPDLLAEIDRLRGALWRTVLSDQGILKGDRPAEIAETALRHRRSDA